MSIVTRRIQDLLASHAKPSVLAWFAGPDSVGKRRIHIRIPTHTRNCAHAELFVSRQLHTGVEKMKSACSVLPLWRLYVYLVVHR